MNLDSAYIIKVINAFKDLNIALENLNSAMVHADHTLPGWFLTPPGLSFNLKANTRDKAATFLKQLDYLDEQAPKEILIGVGIFAASLETLKLIEAVNLRKERFKLAILDLKRHKIPFNDDVKELLKSRPSALNQNLKKMGLARIHLKQCYRKIPILYNKPQKVSWTWSATRAITKVKAKDAYHLLVSHLPGPNIELQLQKLARLDSNTPLAIVQDSAPHLRVNIVNNIPSKIKRKMLKGSMPIFYLEDGSTQLPELVPPKDKKHKNYNRIIRKDLKINPKVFLPAIQAHCYL